MDKLFLAVIVTIVMTIAYITVTTMVGLSPDTIKRAMPSISAPVNVNGTN